ncbi:MAG: hypothetical protein KDA28_16320 [Phycisphaerales bacterium]|nr:hypothetical protein [Phycisphaerales bacterium]
MKHSLTTTLLASAVSAIGAFAGDAVSTAPAAANAAAPSSASTSPAGPSSVVSGIFDRVDARSTDAWRLRLQAGETSTIVVHGDGDTDLDAYLYDENGNLVASDTDGTDLCVLEVSPRWTGQFRLEIRNLGGVFNEYVLTVL